MTTTPTPVQLVRFLERVQAKNPGAKRIGVRFGGTWSGPARLEVKGQPFRLEVCGSALAVREVLADAPEDERIVILTDREERDLGSDVLVRLARRRLFTVDPWIVLGALFGAASLEPRLTRERWLAEALLAAAPPEGYPAVGTGYLTFDAAWDVFAKVVLGLPGGRSDLREALVWGSQPERTRPFREGPAEMKAALRSRLVENGGPAAALVLAAVEAGQADPVALGLVCAALKHPENSRPGELKAAFVRLEQYVGGQQMPTGAAVRLGEDAESVVRDAFRQGGFTAVRPFLDRAETLLAAVKGESAAVVSDLLPSGFDQRLKRLGHALREVLKGKADVRSLEAPEQRVGSHVFARRFPERVDAARMAVRLVRWLDVKRQVGSEPTAFADLAGAYATDGGWVDWARERLGVAEPVKELAGAYREVHAAVTARREAENENFARALVGWSGHASPASGLFGVERVLADVLAPLASKEPVLFLVLDGMSYAVFLQLLADVGERHGWFELGASGARRLIAVSALPTVTEVSRASLLTGALRSGAGPNEKDGFRAHAALLSACKAGRPPALFHKGEIGAGTYGLTDEVSAAIAARENKVVGVVLNAVDDHLDKGDQIRPPWTLQYIPLLGNLLDAAESSGRVVVLTADHGHVVERETQLRTHADAGERSRPATTPAAAGELLAEGPRVVAPGKKVVLAWSETLRYAGKKNGYHGGASPQEALVPLAVLTRHEPLPEGWVALSSASPDWWEPGRAEAAATVPAGARPQQAPLFGPHAEKGRSIVPSLLAAEAFKERLVEVRRQGLTEELAGRVVSALESRGGTMTRATLAKELGMPDLRIPGLVSALRRVLNVEGYSVLSTDEAGGTVLLNFDLLVTQFEL